MHIMTGGTDVLGADPTHDPTAISPRFASDRRATRQPPVKS
jgi:hypothetical protein